ncbi:hypothetical protein KY284_013238 [Solanum tuberosum]|nr:hypothetical protein KY284_013238 [Solanum tuberosum]
MLRYPFLTRNYHFRFHKGSKSKMRMNASGIPKYAKYVKDIVASKRRLTEYETVALTEECSCRIQNRLPKEFKDPGSFTV